MAQAISTLEMAPHARREPFQLLKRLTHMWREPLQLSKRLRARAGSRFKSGKAGAARADGRYTRSGPRRTSIFPAFAPVKSPRNASGAFSIPSTTVSSHFSFPSRIHCPISMKNCGTMSM